MRAKFMLWGAAATLALGSTAALANVVVVKSIGPSAKSYPPGKTLPESAKILLKSGDVVTVIGPGSVKTFRGPGAFDAKQVQLASAAQCSKSKWRRSFSHSKKCSALARAEGSRIGSAARTMAAGRVEAESSPSIHLY